MKTALWLVLAASLSAGCGSDDGDDEERTPPAPPAGTLARFESPRLAFTFDYPRRFAAVRRPGGGVLARIAAERGSRLNAIEVRRTARRELGLGRYLDEFERDLARTFGSVEKRTERVGDLETGVLAVQDMLERRGETVAFTSTSYFFEGGGSTWQVECIADAEHRAEIDEACRIALESVEFTR